MIRKIVTGGVGGSPGTSHDLPVLPGRLNRQSFFRQKSPRHFTAAQQNYADAGTRKICLEWADWRVRLNASEMRIGRVEGGFAGESEIG